MHFRDHFRPRQGEQVVVALELATVVAQPRAAKGGFVELALLDHGAHGAIEQHDALAEHALQSLDARAPFALIDRLDRKGRRRRVHGSGLALAFPIGTRRAVRLVSAGTHALTGTAAPAACGRGRKPSAWQMA